MAINKRMVVKIGTSTLTYENGKLNLRRLDEICRVLTDLNNAGNEIVLVTSGAVGVGVGKLNLQKRPEATEQRQAVAAVGQCELMFMYDRFFGEYNQIAAQILLTKHVTDNAHSRENVQNTFSELLKMHVIPVVNENDTVDTAELEGANFGDNDMLSAIVAHLIQADLLLILTDIDGLYDGDPRKKQDAKIIHRVEGVTEEIVQLAGGKGSSRGTGGMATKVSAARYSTEHSIPCHIINGNQLSNIYRVLDGEEVGTYFAPQTSQDR